jgi:hypothetical protein
MDVTLARWDVEIARHAPKHIFAEIAALEGVTI